MLDFFNKVCYNYSRELFSISLVLGDIATAEADFASIEDGGLTRGRALDGVGESNRKETNILARARSEALARVFILFTRALVSPGISFDNPRRGRQQFPSVAEADGQIWYLGEVSESATITKMQIRKRELVSPEFRMIEVARDVDEVF